MPHLEEGEIHAWLDGAVDRDEGARIESHVASCAQCAAEVAAARGLIAGASRILLSLDAVPGGVIPLPGAASRPTMTSDDPTRFLADSDQSTGVNATGRRQSRWYARSWVRIAAGLFLAAGIGAVATRGGRPDDSLVVEFKTEASSADTADLLLPAATPPASTQVAAAGAAEANASQHARGPVDTIRAAVRPGTPGSRTESRAASTVGVAAAAPSPAAPNPPPTALADAFAVRAGNVAARDAEARVAEAARPATAADAPTSPPPAAPAPASQRPLATNRLSEVVVTGAAETGAVRQARTVAAPTAALQLRASAIPAPALGSACFTLDVASAEPGIPLVPRRMRIQLAAAATGAESDTRAAVATGSNLQGVGVSSGAGAGSGGRIADAAPVPRSYAAPTSEPADPLAWQSVPGDSLVARWATTVDVVEFRLRVIGDQVTGTVAPQIRSGTPATVTGRRIACGGGD